jgi:hypothetical protein
LTVNLSLYDKAQLSELVHEMADPHCGVNHLSQGLLADSGRIISVLLSLPNEPAAGEWASRSAELTIVDEFSHGGCCARAVRDGTIQKSCFSCSRRAMTVFRSGSSYGRSRGRAVAPGRRVALKNSPRPGTLRSSRLFGLTESFTFPFAGKHGVAGSLPEDWDGSLSSARFSRG